MKTPKIYYLVPAVFSIMTLFIGMGHAVDVTQPAVHTMGVHGHGFQGMNMTNGTMQQHILAGLEARGVDVSAAKTLLQNRDTVGVSTWLATYYASYKGERMNATARFNVSSGMPFQREKSGNISAMKIGFHGTMAAGVNLSGTRLPPNNGGMVKNAARCNSTAIISDLEKKGVDVSTVTTALQNGDITTVATWLKSNFATHRNEPAPRNATWGHCNSTGLKSKP